MNYEWIGKNQKKIRSKKIEKPVKSQSGIAVCEQKNHYRESEFLFKHRILTLL